MSNDSLFEHHGSAIDVTWDARLCIHQGECVGAKGDLFQSGRDPWCVPDNTSKESVREIVERCPSGALYYRDKDGTPEAPPPENIITVSYNGPLYATGDLSITGAPEDMPGVRYRAALCRCGHSSNKPFCDNSHRSADFDDPGAVGETGPGLTATGGPLVIKPRTDGPLHITGNLSLRAASGRLAWAGTETALCRCGHSKNKPFCDGSHRGLGFKSA